MKKATTVYTRISLGDLILTKEEEKTIHLSLIDQHGNVLDLDSYLIGYEDENGDECSEDGEYI